MTLNAVYCGCNQKNFTINGAECIIHSAPHYYTLIIKLSARARTAASAATA